MNTDSARGRLPELASASAPRFSSVFICVNLWLRHPATLRFEFCWVGSMLGFGMKRLFRSSLVALLAAAVTSCAYKARVLYHAGDESPPDFLAGPVGVLLTNLDGFSANL